MDINISTKVLENIIGKLDRFGIARLIKTGQVLEGRVIDVKKDALIVNFGKGPVLAKSQVALKRGDFIKAVIKDIKGDILILKLIEKREGVIKKNVESEILKNFPEVEEKEIKIIKSIIKHNIPVNKNSVKDIKFIVKGEEELKKVLSELSHAKDKTEKEVIKERVKSLIRDLSGGYLIERRDDYELILIFPYINEKMELLFQKIRLRYKKKREQDQGKGDKIEFSLNMSKIGPIKVDLSIYKKTIDATIFTSGEDVKEFVKKNIGRLRSSLEDIDFLLRNVIYKILDKSNKVDSSYKKIIKGIDIKI